MIDSAELIEQAMSEAAMLGDVAGDDVAGDDVAVVLAEDLDLDHEVVRRAIFSMAQAASAEVALGDIDRALLDVAATSFAIGVRVERVRQRHAGAHPSEVVG